MKKILSRLLPVLLLFALLSSCTVTFDFDDSITGDTSTSQSAEQAASLDDLPAYSGSPYVVVHNNQPYFSEDDLTEEAFETYSPLDSLGRCGVAYANVCVELMPTEDRGSISSVKPSGWQSIQYDFVDGKSLYNRCHLIGFQLTAENANKQNLITGTRYLNVDGMLPFENMVADYVKETENHVLYRVTPVFTGENLVADGVLMEAMSVEDQGDGVLFCVYCYNVQPGVAIHYLDGSSTYADDPSSEEADNEENHAYILNTASKKFHSPDCSGVSSLSIKNKKEYTGSRQKLLDQGYLPCQNCKP